MDATFEIPIKQIESRMKIQKPITNIDIAVNSAIDDANAIVKTNNPQIANSIQQRLNATIQGIKEASQKQKLRELMFKTTDVKIKAAIAKGLKNGDDYQKIASNIKKEFKMVDLTDDQKQLLGKLADDVEKAAPEDKNIAIAKLFKEVSTLKGVSGFDIFRAAQDLLLLSNPKTHYDYIVGNITEGASSLVGQMAGAPIDKLMSTITGTRTIAKPSTKMITDFIEGGKEGFKVAAKENKAGVSLIPGGEGTFIQAANKRAFDNPQVAGKIGKVPSKVLQKGLDTVYKGLNYIDKTFYHAYHKQVYDQLLRANPAMPIAEADKMAVTAALKASYRHAYDSSKFMKQVVNVANNAPGKLPVGSALEPYTQVASNIFHQGLNYTPFGLRDALIGAEGGAPSIFKLMGEKAKYGEVLPETLKNFDQYNAATNAGKAIVGTSLGLAAVPAAVKAGYYLPKNPTGETTKDRAINQAREAMHSTPESFKFGNLEIGTKNLGAAPNMLNLYSNPNLYKGRPDKALLQTYGQGFGGFPGQNLVKMASNLIENRGDPSNRIAENLGRTLGQAVTPNVLNAANDLIDPYKRDMVGNGFSENFWRSMVGSSPFRSSLPTKIGLFGEAEKKYSNLGEAIINTILPVTIKQNKITPEVQNYLDTMINNKDLTGFTIPKKNTPRDVKIMTGEIVKSYIENFTDKIGKDITPAGLKAIKAEITKEVNSLKEE